VFGLIFLGQLLQVN